MIDHPNIVRLVEVFEDDRHICLVMELMKGGEILQQINDREEFYEEEAREIIAQVVDAANYCHELGIIHRDIKPENLLLSDINFHHLKLVDFGLSRQLDLSMANDLATTSCGSPNYVAPEIIKGKKYGPEVDFWAIGIVTYVLLSSQAPFA